MAKHGKTTYTAFYKKMKTILRHLVRIFSSAVVGLLLFASAVILPAILKINPQRPLQTENKTSADFDTSIDKNDVINNLNNFRLSKSLPVLAQSELLCPSAQYALAQIDSRSQLENILEYCPECISLRLIAVEGTYGEQEIISNLENKYLEDISASEQSICAVSQHDQLAIAIGTTKSPAATSQKDLNTQLETIPKIVYRDIPDQEVIDAINLYRASHNVHQLIIDQNLCNYAQTRVQDLILFGGLDHHQGFKNDFADNNVPEELKPYSGGGIGENLAHQYCYRGAGEDVVANTGVALIEWCFDSSTAGHKEAQLNPSYNAVCVRHGEHMYVVIFGE